MGNPFVQFPAWLVEPVPGIRDPAERMSARALALLLLVVPLVASASAGVVQLVTGDFAAQAAVIVPGSLVLLALQRLARTRLFGWAAWATCLLLLAGHVVICVSGGPGPYWAGFAVVPILVAGLVLRPRSVALVWLLAVGTLPLIGAVVPEIGVTDVGQAVAMNLVVGALATASAAHWRTTVSASAAELSVASRNAAMLRALETAASEMAHARDEVGIFASVGDTLRDFGYHTTVLELDGSDLRLAYLSTGATTLRQVEQMVGISPDGFRFPADTTRFHRRILAGETVFERNGSAIAEAIVPAPAPVMRTGMSILGISRMIGTPVLVDDEVVAALVVAASDLHESDVPIVATFGRQVSATLERERLLTRLEGRIERHLATLRELETSQEQLVRAQKLEAVSVMAGGLAHDFNNILTVVLTNLDVVRHELADRSDTESVLGCVDDMEKVVSRASVLTRQLLLFARGEVGQARTLDVADMVEELRPLLRNAIPESIDIEHAYAEGPQPVFIEPGRVEQILFNLALNARDAMEDGGTLRVAVRPFGSSVELAIVDTGTGMDPDTLARAFDPFYTTKGEGGSGLGLMMVRQIVEAAGGSIELDSTLGVGTTVRVRFPRVAPARSLTPSASGGWVVRSGVLLLCDDDEGIRNSVARILERAGYTVIRAGAPSEALAVTARLERLDVVVSDVVLPEMPGPQLLERLRERFPDVPALFISGYAPGMGQATAAAELLQKPFSPDVLLSRVAELMPPGEA